MNLITLSDIPTISTEKIINMDPALREIILEAVKRDIENKKSVQATPFFIEQIVETYIFRKTTPF